MRIALVTTEFITEKDFDGGLANYLYRLSISLIKLEHEPVIIVLSNRNEILYHNNIEVHRVRTSRLLELLNRATRGRIMPPIIWMHNSWRLNRVTKKIHKSNPLSIVQYASYSAVGLFHLKNVPSIVRISSYQPLLNKGYGLVKKYWVHYMLEYLERVAFIKANAIFGPSKLIAGIIEKDLQRTVRIIETPFMLEATDLDDSLYHECLENKKYLLFFGSLGLLKGVKVIADIIEDLLRNHMDLYFVFAGKDSGFNSKPMVEYLLEKAGQYKDRVIYLGKMHHKQLYPIIRKSLAVVLPSRIDNFPNTCLEAMGHKRVIIGTYDTSFEQLLCDGECGFLCKNDNSKDLLDTIEKVLRLSIEQREEIGEKAYIRVKNLEPDKVVTELIAYYNEIIANFIKSYNLNAQR